MSAFCSKCPLKTLWEKEKLLVTSNFSFSHGIFNHFRELSAIYIKFNIVVCKLFQFGRVQNLSSGKGLNFYLSSWTWNNTGAKYLNPSKMTNFVLSKTERVQKNLYIHVHGEKFSKGIENSVGKGDIAHNEQFLLFPVFSQDLYCSHVKRRACLRKANLLRKEENADYLLCIFTFFDKVFYT